MEKMVVRALSGIIAWPILAVVRLVEWPVLAGQFYSNRYPDLETQLMIAAVATQVVWALVIAAVIVLVAGQR